MARFPLVRVLPQTDVDIEEMILAHEGGIFTNHPLDHGGPTKWGITLALLSRYRGRTCTPEDVKNLTREEAIDIYRRFFIRPFDGLSIGLKANVVDMGVNAGVPRATMLLQQTVGANVDATMGPKTLALANARAWSDLYAGVRLAYYENIIVRDSTQVVWRNGWRNRTLSFIGGRRLRHAMPNLEPAFGFIGKAYAA